VTKHGLEISYRAGMKGRTEIFVLRAAPA